MLRLAAVIGLLAAPAAADVATISGCIIEKRDWHSDVFCDVQNLSGAAIAEISTVITVLEEGRTIPWAKQGSETRPNIASVAGGIEPGETRNLWIWQVAVPKEANWDKLRVDVIPVRFSDINGDEILPLQN